MALAYRITVSGAAATTLADRTTLGGGGSVLVKNASLTTTCYVGGDENTGVGGAGAALTTSNGFELGPGAAISVRLDGKETLRAISATTTISVTAHVFRSNLGEG